MAYTDREDLNYLGQLYLIGANQTPLLNMLGGLSRGGRVANFTFPMAQPYALDAAAQPAITEAASVSSNTAETTTRGQDFNTVQIFQETVEVSYAKQSTTGDFAGIQVIGDQPVKDEFGFQKETKLKQIAVDMEYTLFNGVYQLSTGTAVAAKTRGLATGISTNTVAAGSVDLTKALIDELMRTMAAGGSQFNNMILFANALQVQRVSDIYGYAPASRTVGGVAVIDILTDFAKLGVVYAPQMPTDSIFVVDMSIMEMVFCPMEGKIIKFDELAQIAASRKGQWYMQAGLNYGAEEYHGSITGLTTS